MDTRFLEHFYETVILPLYKEEVSISSVSWKDHGKVGLDTWAHYFEDKSGREFVLLNEDFPGNEYLNDDITHEVIRFGSEISLRFSITPEVSIENITGYFTLYAEKQH